MHISKIKPFLFEEVSVFYFRAGDRILVADDSNDDWWKVGKKPAHYT